MRLRISKLFFSLMVIAGTLSVPAFAINLQPGFDTGPLAASQVTPSCQNWSKNLSCADNNQQAVDDVVDQLSSGGGQANLSLIKGTYSDGDMCTYTASGTLLNCNTVIPTECSLSSCALNSADTATTQSATDNSTKVATTAYVTTGISNAISGVNPAVAVQAATTAAGDTSGLTYNNGVGGVGATFTGSVNTAITIDGYTFTATGQRLLVKNDTQSPSGAYKGIYSLTQAQTLLLPPIFTRATDYNQPSDINNTGAIPVVNGTVNGTTSWLLTSQVTTVGTDPLTYVKFSSSPSTLAPLASPTFTGTVTTPALNISGLTASQILALDGSDNVQSLSTTTYPSLTELSYVKGVTSAIQTQLNAKGAGTITGSGTTGQVATFSSSTALTSVASNTVGGMTLVASGSPSAVSSFTISGLSYSNKYTLYLDLTQNTSSGSITIANNNSSSAYGQYIYNSSTTAISGTVVTNGSSFNLNPAGNIGANNHSSHTIYFHGHPADSVYMVYNAFGGNDNANENTYQLFGTMNTTTLASITITTSAGTMTGTYALYQLN